MLIIGQGVSAMATLGTAGDPKDVFDGMKGVAGFIGESYNRSEEHKNYVEGLNPGSGSDSYTPQTPRWDSLGK